LSADNGMTIIKTERGYEVMEWFGDGGNFSPRGVFSTLEEAIAKAQSEYTEYGLSFDLGEET
jgi:hypothetical protein